MPGNGLKQWDSFGYCPPIAYRYAHESMPDGFSLYKYLRALTVNLKISKNINLK